MPKKRSAVWLYFEMIDKISAKCTLCERNLKSYGSTGNLIDHLRRRHSSIVSINSLFDVEDTQANDCREESQLLESSSDSDNDIEENSSSNLYFAEEGDNSKLDHALVNLIACNFQPISMISGKGFQGLVKTLRPNYTLPTRREFLTHQLPSCYNTARSQVKSLIDQAENVSIAIDVWKLKYRCFVTCYAHCILKSKLHCFLLATEQIPYFYTPKSIVNAVSTMAVDWDIDNKIACVVIDNNDPIMISSIKELELPYLPCINYTVRQIVANVFEFQAVIELRKACNTIVNYFEENAAVSNKLTELQLLAKQPKQRLLGETQFKLRTTYCMFKRLLKMKSFVFSAINKRDGAPDPLTDAECDILSDCVQLLDPLFSMMKKIRSMEHQIASEIIPRINTAHKLIVSFSPVSEDGCSLKSILIKGFEDRLFFYMELKVALHSTILHPRFKEYASKDDAHTTLINELTTEHEKSFIDGDGSQFDVSRDKANNDYKKYLNMGATFEENDNPFLFWEEIGKTSPILAKLALKYMCIPSHLLIGQKLFSKQKFVGMLNISNLRAKKNIDKLIFLHAFSKYKGYDFE